MVGLGNGKIYIIDSTIYNVDPDSVAISEEGTKYIEFDITNQFTRKTNCGIDVDYFPGASGWAIGLEERYDVVTIEILEPTRATMKLLQKFITLHSKTSDNQTYLIIRHGASNYETFYDDNRVEREYLMGWITGDIIWRYATRNQFYNTTLTFSGVWT